MPTLDPCGRLTQGTTGCLLEQFPNLVFYPGSHLTQP